MSECTIRVDKSTCLKDLNCTVTSDMFACKIARDVEEQFLQLMLLREIDDVFKGWIHHFKIHYALSINREGWYSF